MTKRLLFLIITLLCWSAHAEQPGPAKTQAANELQLRNDIQKQVSDALRSGEIDTLEKMSQSFRNDKSRTPSGVWKLSLFYRYIVMAKDTRELDTSESVIDKWVAAYPDSPSPHVAKTRMLMARAWLIRGNGTVDSVPASAWKSFGDNLRLAFDNQAKYKAIANADPEWHEVNIELALNSKLTREQFDALLQQAIKHERDYENTYFIALRYLTPQWHGSWEEFDQLARKVEQWTSPEAGHSMYARIYWDLSKNTGNNIFRTTKVSWPEMKLGFEDVMAHYPSDWNLNAYAKFACLAGDMDTTKTLIARIWNDMVTIPSQLHQTVDLSTMQTVWDEEHTSLFSRCKAMTDGTMDKAHGVVTRSGALPYGSVTHGMTMR